MAREESMIFVSLKTLNCRLLKRLSVWLIKDIKEFKNGIPGAGFLTKNRACGELTEQAKKENRQLASLRVIGEHINRRLKIFKILAERYRNRRKRFALRFNLLAGLYNYELRLSPTESAS